MPEQASRDVAARRQRRHDHGYEVMGGAPQADDGSGVADPGGYEEVDPTGRYGMVWYSTRVVSALFQLHRDIVFFL
jgi:hypothetical protein